MKRQLLETEKNYLTCTVLMVLIGIALIGIGRESFGIVVLSIAAVFAVMTVLLVAKDIKEEKERDASVNKPESEKNDRGNEG